MRGMSRKRDRKGGGERKGRTVAVEGVTRQGRLWGLSRVLGLDPFCAGVLGFLGYRAPGFWGFVASWPWVLGFWTSLSQGCLNWDSGQGNLAALDFSVQTLGTVHSATQTM